MAAAAAVLQPLGALSAQQPGGQEPVGLQAEAAAAHGPSGAHDTACKDPGNTAEVQGAAMELGAAAASAVTAPPLLGQDAAAQDVQQPPAPGELGVDFLTKLFASQCSSTAVDGRSLSQLPPAAPTPESYPALRNRRSASNGNCAG